MPELAVSINADANDLTAQTPEKLYPLWGGIVRSAINWLGAGESFDKV